MIFLQLIPSLFLLGIVSSQNSTTPPDTPSTIVPTTMTLPIITTSTLPATLTSASASPISASLIPSLSASATSRSPTATPSSQSQDSGSGSSGNGTGLSTLAIVGISILASAFVIATVGIWFFRRQGISKPSRTFKNRLDGNSSGLSSDGSPTSKEAYHHSIAFVTETSAPSRF